MPKFSPPAEVLEIASRLEDAGFEAWCVGGAIRDALLGHAHLDWDLATSARPEDVRRLFRRTVPVGIAFGTVGVLDTGGVMHEVTTFRRDVKTDGRHAVVEFGASLEEDLARRDLTVNAIAYSPSSDTVYDPFGGEDDVRRRLIRAVGSAADRMREDRLRALRAIRFAARFDFEIEPETWASIAESAPHMTRLSAERVKQEIEKTMEQVRCPSSAFSLWQRSGALAVLIPALSHAKSDDFDHLDRTGFPSGRRASERRILRIASLFALATPGKVPIALRDLRFSNSDTNWISSVVSAWAELSPGIERALLNHSRISDGEIRRWASIAGRTRFAHIMRLAAAFWGKARAAGEPAPTASKVASLYRRGVRAAYNDPIEIADLAVDGTDLQKIGITGARVGSVLRMLLDAVVDDPRRNEFSSLLDIAGRSNEQGKGTGDSRKSPTTQTK